MPTTAVVIAAVVGGNLIMKFLAAFYNNIFVDPARSERFMRFVSVRIKNRSGSWWLLAL